MPGAAAYRRRFGTVRRAEPHARRGARVWGAWNAAEVLARAAQRPARATGACCTRLFPLPELHARITRPDADALFAYLRSLPPSSRANDAHTLQFPFDSAARARGCGVAAVISVPRKPEPDAGRQPPKWNRGAYLVEGLWALQRLPCESQRARCDSEPGPTWPAALIPVQNW